MRAQTKEWCVEIPFSSYPVLISVSIKNKFQRGAKYISWRKYWSREEDSDE